MNTKAQRRQTNSTQHLHVAAAAVVRGLLVALLGVFVGVLLGVVTRRLILPDEPLGFFDDDGLWRPGLAAKRNGDAPLDEDVVAVSCLPLRTRTFISRGDLHYTQHTTHKHTQAKQQL